MTPEQIQSLIDERIAQHIDNKLADLQAQITSLASSVKNGGGNVPEHRATLMVLSGDLDKLFAAFSIALGAAANDMQVSMFFTFWGLNALRTGRTYSNKDFTEKMVAAMLPSDPSSVPVSKMNMLGIGPVFFKHLMKKKNVQSLPDMIALARETGVRIIACDTSMHVMGIQRSELLPDLDYGGVATYMEVASKSKITLFI